MPFAVVLLLNGSAAEAIRSLWRELADARLSVPLLDLELPPHLTLASYDTIEVGEARPAFTSFAAEETPEPVALSTIGTFPGDAGVLYLAPVPTRGLLELHAGFHERFSALDQPVGAHYFPGTWVPHVTLAMGLSDADLARAIALVRQSQLPIEGQLDRLELVEFQKTEAGLPAAPIRVHQRHALGR
ncbi:MAG: 2'-5' RNA ligase family protein [Planctomycetota bacterium]|nr:2'-5' RNA ligase family protein [Planctomycetota bacterium]